MISKIEVAKFKKLYLREFNIRLTDEQAISLGTDLIKLVRIVYGTELPKKWRSIKFDRFAHKKLS